MIHESSANCFFRTKVALSTQMGEESFFFIISLILNESSYNIFQIFFLLYLSGIITFFLFKIKTCGNKMAESIHSVLLG